MAFAAHIRDGVERTFDVRLHPECDLINCSLDDPAPGQTTNMIRDSPEQSVR